MGGQSSIELRDSTGAALPMPLSKDIEIADIGCGFGGLLMALSPELPDTLILGKRTTW
jgi:tRNA (guanine-N7-)-methyltransferase